MFITLIDVLLKIKSVIKEKILENDVKIANISNAINAIANTSLSFALLAITPATKAIIGKIIVFPKSNNRIFEFLRSSIDDSPDCIKYWIFEAEYQFWLSL